MLVTIIVLLLICGDVFTAETRVDKESYGKVTEVANENLKNILDNSTDIFYRTDSQKIYISSNLKNWKDAARSCEYFGMSLISITSQKDLLKLDKLLLVNNLEPMNNIDGYWLSGHHTERGNFNWTSVNKQIDCWGWLPGEPNNLILYKPEDCVELRTQDNLVHFGWNNLQCDEKRRFICEKLIFDKDSLANQQEEDVIEQLDTSCYKSRIPMNSFMRIG